MKNDFYTAGFIAKKIKSRWTLLEACKTLAVPL